MSAGIAMSKPTLLLDDMRKEFSTFLSADTTGRWRMDAALAHVVKLAFESGIAAGKASMSGHISELETENLDMRARLDKVRILNILNQHAAPAEANIAANRIIDGLRIKTEEHQCCTEDLLALRKNEQDGWKEAAIAWEVCASIHNKWAKGKDALYSTRHADFVKHADDARQKLTHNVAIKPRRQASA